MEPDQQKLSLSQKVILLINSLPEVSCTLVGIRSQSYVKDVLSSVKSNYIEKKIRILEDELGIKARNCETFTFLSHPIVVQRNKKMAQNFVVYCLQIS